MPARFILKFGALFFAICLSPLIFSCILDSNACKSYTTGTIVTSKTFNDSLAIVETWAESSPRKNGVDGPSCGDNTDPRVDFFMVNTLRKVKPVRGEGDFPSSLYLSSNRYPSFPQYAMFNDAVAFYAAVIEDSSIAILRFNSNQTTTQNVYALKSGVPKYFASIQNKQLLFYDSSVTQLESGVAQSIRYHDYFTTGTDYVSGVSVYGDTALAWNFKANSLCFYRKTPTAKSGFCVTDSMPDLSGFSLNRDKMVYRGALQGSAYPVSTYRIDFANQTYTLISKENQSIVAILAPHSSLDRIVFDSVTYNFDDFY